MKTTLIFLISLMLYGCNSSAPRFPDLKFHYLIISEGSKPICVRYDIISLRPYKITNPTVFDISSCESVGGYKPEDMQAILNWSEDIIEWAEKHKECNSDSTYTFK